MRSRHIVWSLSKPWVSPVTGKSPTPHWRKSKVWNKIFSPHYDAERYIPQPYRHPNVPLWDIAPGCILWLPPEPKLASEHKLEIEKYGNIEQCGHPVIVLAVDVKGVNEGLVGVAPIRAFSQHADECRFLGSDWFASTHFEIQRISFKYRDNWKAPAQNIKQLRQYKHPMANIDFEYRQFVETTDIFTVPYQALQAKLVLLPERWWPSATLNGWTKRIIKADFMEMCEIIGFKPDPWASSGPYMWKAFVEKTGIDTFGFDLEDPSLYDEKAFYLHLWEEGQEKYKEFYGEDIGCRGNGGVNDLSPLGWYWDQSPDNSRRLVRWTRKGIIKDYKDYMIRMNCNVRWDYF